MSADKHVTSINGMGAITESGGVYTTTGMEANDHMYIAEDLVKNPGVANKFRGDLIVTEASTPGKKVLIQGGTCYVLNSDYSESSLAEQKYWRTKISGEEEVAISDNVSGNPRIDIVCVKIDDTVTPNDEATNVASYIIVEGTPAASPSVPATPNDHLKLAEVAVANGFSSIVNANITDKRNDITVSDNSLGWISTDETWTFDDDTYDPTFSFTITGDYTDKYCVGMKLKLTQGSTVKYFIVTKVAYSSPDTTIHVYGGTDYTLTSDTITDTYFALPKTSPYGFPMDTDSWTEEIEVSDLDSRTGATYGALDSTNLKLNVPIGHWKLCMDAVFGASNSSGTEIEATFALSSSTSSASNSKMLVYIRTTGASGYIRDFRNAYKEDYVTTTAETGTAFYIIGKQTVGSTGIFCIGTGSPSIIRAVCAYL